MQIMGCPKWHLTARNTNERIQLEDEILKARFEKDLKIYKNNRLHIIFFYEFV